MKRQIVLLACLTAAVAVAVLLRTASPNVDIVTVADVDSGDQKHLSVAQITDCAITPEQAPQLASSDAAQPIPVSPLAVADMAVSRTADTRSETIAPSPEATGPRPQRHSLRITIRPPPASSSA